MIRSMLFVPADSERKLSRSVASNADALILDLEDSVASSRKAQARAMARTFLGEDRGSKPQLWVRINDLTSDDVLLDLAAIVGGAPDGIVLPKANGPADVQTLDRYLSALEVREGVAHRSIQVIAVATETAAAIGTLGQYGPGLPRLTGLTWGAEDLAASLGASDNRDAEGKLRPVFELARSLCLCAAAAAGVQAMDTAFMGLSDPEGLRETCGQARRDGYFGALAIHPDQVPVINAAFSPTQTEAAEARRVVEAFGVAGIGVARLDGRMLDRPHLKQAERMLALWARIGSHDRERAA